MASASRPTNSSMRWASPTSQANRIMPLGELYRWGGAMTIKNETVMGNVGYRSQLDRSRRFLNRVGQANKLVGWTMNDVDFQDMMWAFFQNCWAVSDWLRHDPLAPEVQKSAAWEMVKKSKQLVICQDICNGTKHLKLTTPHSGVGAQHRHISTKITPGEDVTSQMDCMVDDGFGNKISGMQLGRDCMSEWDRILGSQGLATARMS
jgi:hypothetical protein